MTPDPMKAIPAELKAFQDGWEEITDDSQPCEVVMEDDFSSTQQRECATFLCTRGRSRLPYSPEAAVAIQALSTAPDMNTELSDKVAFNSKGSFESKYVFRMMDAILVNAWRAHQAVFDIAPWLATLAEPPSLAQVTAQQMPSSYSSPRSTRKTTCGDATWSAGEVRQGSLPTATAHFELSWWAFFRPNSGNNSGVMRAWTCHGRNQRDLVEKLKQAGIIKTPEVAKVLEQVDRANFIPRNSYMDAPQTIGMGQTISAPHMHAHVLEEMLCALVGKENVKILDVGCGSGYLTAALGRWVSSKHDVPGSGNILGVRSGKVFGIDVHQDLVDLTKENIRKQDGDLLQRDVVKVMLRDGWKGLKEEAPFDAIHVGAAADSLPQQLVSQLKVNGVMIIPIGIQTEAQILYKIHRIRETPGEGDSFHPEDFEMSTLLGVRYVPLVHTETN
ncbi:protein-L-isoaspartate O-methyltransferase [Nitzschia inconspicua]|uniref:Protein-L-isoaspartate O-methyltransferase n=1 Tax=Nitzschia inconspicua TaxID=303405 RepID=A0A9K3PEQ4_9STRA|nr:protein-L-isoaspartate O-methyltransferase [Nitzschia inconspicua]